MRPFAQASLAIGFFVATAEAQSTTRVSVRVVDDALNQGVPARITLVGADSVSVYAGADGRATLVVRPGRYRIATRAIGYRPTLAEVDLDTSRDLRIAVHPTALPLDAVVVTAARREQRLQDTPITTELVTSRDIAVTGASDLASVLVEQTGIELQGGIPNGAGVMLQGIGSERVLVLVDGQPVAGRIGGLLDVSRLPTTIIDRVEVVKGPQSTLYGSEAMGGVINVVTRRPQRMGLTPRASARVGTQSRVEANGGLDFGGAAVAITADVGRRSIETTAGRSTDAGSMSARLDGSTSARWTIKKNATASASVLTIDERQRWLSGSLYQIADNRQLLARTSAELVLGRTQVTPLVGYSSLNHVLRASTLPRPISGDTGHRQVQHIALGGVTTSTALGRHRFDAGVEAKHEAIRAERVLGTRRSVWSVEPFSQLELGIGKRVSLVPGARLSWNEQWGSNVSPRLAVRASLSPTLTARMSAGTGYRAPDFKELYLSFQNENAQYAVQGNLDLRPEHSQNVAGGLEWAADRVYARGQVFHNELRDFIETRVVSPEGAPLVFQYGNVDDGSTSGADLEAGVVWPRLRLESGVGLLRTRDHARGTELLGRPPLSARLGATLTSRFARMSLTQLFTGRTAMTRDEASGGVSDWRDAFVRTDVRIALPRRWGAEPALGIDNLFDNQPARWATATARHMYVTLAWRPEP